jgi:hypothetical protein
MPTSEFLRVKNFEKFQHYSQRKPPWIKVYFSLLSDSDFSQMSDASKLHTIAIMLLASQHDNKIPFDKAWIYRAIFANNRINWQELFASGFIICYQDASELLAPCKQSAIVEESRVYKEEDIKRVEEIAESDKAFSLSATDGIYSVTNENIVHWHELYPAVDILSQLRSMEGWLWANKTRKKTLRGMPRFINSWLDDKQNKGTGSGIKQEHQVRPVDPSEIPGAIIDDGKTDYNKRR